MKKTIILLCVVSLSKLLTAQVSSSYISTDRLFLEAKTMFLDKNYAGCMNKLSEYKLLKVNPGYLQEMDYLYAACAYNQGRKDAALLLKEYLENYPDNIHKDESYLMIGSVHFSQKDYEKALFWMKQADMDRLSVSDQEDLAYRMAYSNMEVSKNDEARRLFSLLKDNSSKYKDAANYYLGYLDYKEKEYQSALAAFEKLKNNPEFKESALYYLTQIHFIQGRNTQAINEGEALLKAYPNSQNNAEVYRILGNAYYLENNRPKTVEYLNKYVKTGKDLQRNDLYILGLCYYEAGNYTDAITYLSQSITQNDEIGQNSYLYLGQAYLKTNDKKNAIMAFEAASRHNYDKQVKEAATYNYAMLVHENSVSAFGESVTILENFLNEFPDSRYADKVNDCLVDVYLTTKNYDAALASIDKISRPGTKILEAKQKIYYHLGTVAYANNNFNEAIDYFTKSLNTGNYAIKEKADSRYWRADSYYRSGKYTLAITDYKSYIQDGVAGDSHLLTLADYNLGYCYFKMKDYSSALNNFSSYIKKERDFSLSSLADAYNRQGDCYFNARRFKDAETSYADAVRIQPSTGDYAMFQSGFVMGLQKNYKGKIEQMDKLIAKYPESSYITDAIYEKGRSYVLLENSSAAIKTYEELITKYPQSDNARKAGIQIGLLYFNDNKLQQAADAYKSVISKYPGSEEARVAMQDLKSVYLEMDDINGYAQYVKKLGGEAKFEPSEQDSLTYLAAEKQFMKGDIQQAQNSLKNYLQSFPQGAFRTKAHYYLASTYNDRKDYVNAKKEYQTVLDAGDNEFTEPSLLAFSEILYNNKDYAGALQAYQRLSAKTDKKDHKETALLGITRCALKLNKPADVINASTTLLKDPGLSPEINAEATYSRAKAYLSLKEGTKAVADLKNVAKDTRTTFGAEGKYLLAQYYYDNKQPDKAETEVMDYIKQGTPHAYWMARSFILLSDISIDKGDKFQAQQYLESLQHNYKETNDDIESMIHERLAKLQK